MATAQIEAPSVIAPTLKTFKDLGISLSIDGVVESEMPKRINMTRLIGVKPAAQYNIMPANDADTLLPTFNPYGNRKHGLDTVRISPDPNSKKQ